MCFLFCPRIIWFLLYGVYRNFEKCPIQLNVRRETVCELWIIIYVYITKTIFEKQNIGKPHIKLVFEALICELSLHLRCSPVRSSTCMCGCIILCVEAFTAPSTYIHTFIYYIYLHCVYNMMRSRMKIHNLLGKLILNFDGEYTICDAHVWRICLCVCVWTTAVRSSFHNFNLFAFVFCYKPYHMFFTHENTFINSYFLYKVLQFQMISI